MNKQPTLVSKVRCRDQWRRHKYYETKLNAPGARPKIVYNHRTECLRCGHGAETKPPSPERAITRLNRAFRRVKDSAGAATRALARFTGVANSIKEN